MAGKLAMRVLESGLSPTLKPTLVVMALFERGEGIYPSVDRVAFLLGVKRRQVNRQLATLRRLGVLVPRENSLGGGRLASGRGRSVVYDINLDALPVRDPFGRNPDVQAKVNPDVQDRVQTLTSDARTLTSTPRTLTCTPPNTDLQANRSLRVNLEEEQKERSKPIDAPRRDVLSHEDRTHRCDECDWTGNVVQATAHYSKTRHTILKSANNTTGETAIQAEAS